MCVYLCVCLGRQDIEDKLLNLCVCRYYFVILLLLTSICTHRVAMHARGGGVGHEAVVHNEHVPQDEDDIGQHEGREQVDM